jgi:hypothetical protein
MTPCGFCTHTLIADCNVHRVGCAVIQTVHECWKMVSRILNAVRFTDFGGWAQAEARGWAMFGGAVLAALLRTSCDARVTGALLRPVKGTPR